MEGRERDEGICSLSYLHARLQAISSYSFWYHACLRVPVTSFALSLSRTVVGHLSTCLHHNELGEGMVPLRPAIPRGGVDLRRQL